MIYNLRHFCVFFVNTWFYQRYLFYNDSCEVTDSWHNSSILLPTNDFLCGIITFLFIRPVILLIEAPGGTKKLHAPPVVCGTLRRWRTIRHVCIVATSFLDGNYNFYFRRMHHAWLQHYQRRSESPDWLIHLVSLARTILGPDFVVVAHPKRTKSQFNWPRRQVRGLDFRQSILLGWWSIAALKYVGIAHPTKVGVAAVMTMKRLDDVTVWLSDARVALDRFWGALPASTTHRQIYVYQWRCVSSLQCATMNQCIRLDRKEWIFGSRLLA